MERLNEFRLFYNHTIHPELLRMERKRKRLLTLLFLSCIVLIFVLILQIYVHILAVTLILLILVGFYIAYLVYKIREFKVTFKPNVINLIMDFIDDDINYGTLTYEAKRKIPKKDFLRSALFATDAPFYEGEDYIKGSYRELTFELSELNVKEYSKVRNRLNYIFKGIFLVGVYAEKSKKGRIIVLPRDYQQYQSRTVKEFYFKGGKPVNELMTRSFDKVFITLASRGLNIEQVLSRDMQKALLNFRERTDKEIYVSFIDNKVYVAVTEPKDILEPEIFYSNVSFDLLREFFEELQLLLSILEDLDVNN